MLKTILERGLAELKIDASGQQIELWLAYVELLNKWNKAYNLTAVRDPAEMVSRHVLDSLAVSKHVTSQDMLDVGAGPGIPCIPLAILWPDRTLTGLDSNGKKTRFMQQAQVALKLANFSAVQSRIEQYQRAPQFDGIMSRAFAQLEDFVNGSQHLLAENGTFWAMKAQLDDGELSRVPKPFKVEACIPLAVPNCDAERHLIVMSRA